MKGCLGWTTFAGYLLNKTGSAAKEVRLLAKVGLLHPGILSSYGLCMANCQKSNDKIPLLPPHSDAVSFLLSDVVVKVFGGFIDGDLDPVDLTRETAGFLGIIW